MLRDETVPPRGGFAHKTRNCLYRNTCESRAAKGGLSGRLPRSYGVVLPKPGGRRRKGEGWLTPEGPPPKLNPLRERRPFAHVSRDRGSWVHRLPPGSFLPRARRARACAR